MEGDKWGTAYDLSLTLDVLNISFAYHLRLVQFSFSDNLRQLSVAYFR